MAERSLRAAEGPVLATAGRVTGPVLAIETVTDTLGVALASGQELLGEVNLQVGNRHLETLHCLIVEMLDHLGLGFSDLAGFGVDLGPGKFTGTRVGVAAARAFARALGKPLVGFTSLELLAEGVARSGLAAVGASVLSVVDARRGEVFFQPFRLEQPPSSGASPVPVACAHAGLTRPDRLRAMVTRGEIPGVDGSTIRLDGELLGTPRAAVVALVAAERLAAETFAGSSSQCAQPGGIGDPAKAVPVYLRAPDTRIKWETRDVATATS
jgi:tRNA threonylcarbamoyladenosine biosynthesis protein TsaB